MEKLAAEWASAWHKLGLVIPDDDLYQSLIAAWSEPHRHYHTVQHIRECFARLKELEGQACHPGEVGIALWFHDAFYDVHRHDNEERSAQWACACLAKAGAAPAVIDRVHSLIMSTASHDGVLAGDSRIVVDVDLSILGAPSSRYDEYEQQIRAEYSFVPQQVFASKRASILQGFLDRPRIFNTQVFFERYEQAARSNLARAIARLGSVESGGESGSGPA